MWPSNWRYESTRLLAEARILKERIRVERDFTGVKGELEAQEGVLGRERNFREAHFERLDWPAMRRHAEDVLQRLRALKIVPADEPVARRIREAAEWDFVRAAYEMNDDAAVLAHLKHSGWAVLVPGADADMQPRYEAVRDQLAPIHVLFRSGEAEAARAALARLWPEVEAVETRAGGRPRLIADVARAYEIKAEIEVAGGVERRRFLERAANCLRPFVKEGRLTRYEREVVLRRIERKLSE